MSSSQIDKIVNQVFTERALHDFYCVGETCVGWERNVLDQPHTVKKIIDKGADRIAAGIGVGGDLPDRDIARMIDHTLLKPDATPDEIKVLCAEAKEYNFASVCINPIYVPLCYELLKNTP